MEEKIINSLLLREGMPKREILADMLEDCKRDLQDMLHVKDLNESHTSILKEMVLIRVNHDGIDGISSESNGGVSTAYLNDLPKSLIRKIRSKRKLKR